MGSATAVRATRSTPRGRERITEINQTWQSIVVGTVFRGKVGRGVGVYAVPSPGEVQRRSPGNQSLRIFDQLLHSVLSVPHFDIGIQSLGIERFLIGKPHGVEHYSVVMLPNGLATSLQAYYKDLERQELCSWCCGQAGVTTTKETASVRRTRTATKARV